MSDTRTQLEEERHIINAAKEFYSLPLQLQPWGPQNQNGDYCESILMDADGETVVYGIPDEIGDLAALASTALPLRNAQVEAALKLAEEMDRRPESANTVDHYIEMGFQLAARKFRRAIEEAGG